MTNFLTAPVCALMLTVAVGTATAQEGGPMMNQPGSGMMGQGMMSPGLMGHGMMMGRMMGPEMMIVMMDTNDDGQLSLEEFLAIHTRMFKLLDKDGDGQLTSDEIKKRWSQDGEND